MISGKGEDSLKEALRKIDNCTTVDSLIKNGQKIVIEATREKGRIGAWHILDKKGEETDKKGNNYGSLVDALTGENTIMGFGGQVLCYWKSDGVRLYDGKTVSTWLVIYPGVPCFEDESGLPAFETMELALTQKEYDQMRETSLALYEDDVIYAISQEAILSLGNFLDCSALFSKIDKDRFMLGIAIEIGEKLSLLHRKIDLICKKTSRENFKIVRSIVGNKYKKESFIIEALQYLANYNQFEVTEWKKTDYEIECTLKRLSVDPDENQWIVLTSGTVSGVPSTVTAYTSVDGIDCPLYYVSKPKRINITTDSYFEGMMDALDAYDPQKLVTITQDDVDTIKKAVGLSRWSKAYSAPLVAKTETKAKPIKAGKIAFKDLVTDISPLYKIESKDYVAKRLDKFLIEKNVRG